MSTLERPERGIPFFKIIVKRFTATLPACLCAYSNDECPGHVDYKPGRKRPLGELGWSQVQAEQFEAVIVSGKISAPTGFATPSIRSANLHVPRAAKADPTPEQIAAIMAKFWLTPEGDYLPPAAKGSKS